MNKHIVVLLGGTSAEREVSLCTGAAASAALQKLGYRVTELDAKDDFVSKLIALKPDCVYNALHGTHGEDGCIPGVLEVLGIPYTHSGVLASAIAMNKAMTRKLLEGKTNVRFPKGAIWRYQDLLELAEKNQDPMPRPFVIKPVSEGSSFGVIIAQKNGSTKTEITAETLWRCEEFMVEEYIPGRELSASVWDKGSLCVVELRPLDGFFDYANKYIPGKTEHFLPAPIPDEVTKLALDMALTAHKNLGCVGFTRSDFRYNDSGVDGLYFLEINTHPGMTTTSIVPESAAYAGIDFESLVTYLIQTARCGK
jgi:D-alanine-D-alanine ligase